MSSITIPLKTFCEGSIHGFFYANLLPYSPGGHGDIFSAFGTKAITQNLKSLPRGNQLSFVS